MGWFELTHRLDALSLSGQNGRVCHCQLRLLLLNGLSLLDYFVQTTRWFFQNATGCSTTVWEYVCCFASSFTTPEDGQRVCVNLEAALSLSLHHRRTCRSRIWRSSLVNTPRVILTAGVGDASGVPSISALTAKRHVGCLKIAV